MVPRNNPKKFVERWGEWWYIREFDYLPEPLKYYDRNISTLFMREAANGHFDLFRTREAAMDASYHIRLERGIEPFSFDRDYLFSHELEEKKK